MPSDAHDILLMYADMESQVSTETLVDILQDFPAQALAGEVRISEPLDVEEIASALARLVRTGELPLNQMQELAGQFARFVEHPGNLCGSELIELACDGVPRGRRILNPDSQVRELT